MLLSKKLIAVVAGAMLVASMVPAAAFAAPVKTDQPAVDAVVTAEEELEEEEWLEEDEELYDEDEEEYIEEDEEEEESDPADDSIGANLSWTLENGTLKISGTGKMKEFGYRSQSGVKFNGKSIWYHTTAPWKGMIDDITAVEIGEGVTSVGISAFEGCYKISSISLPSTLKSISTYAFYNCVSLTSLDIPESVTHIGSAIVCQLPSEAPILTHTQYAYDRMKSQHKNTFMENAPQNIKVWRVIRAVNYSSLRSKTVAPITKMTGVKGAVTYAKAEGDDCLKVDASTGKVTVAKGTPAGDYPMVIRITAAATEDGLWAETEKLVHVRVRVCPVKPAIAVTRTRSAVVLPVKADKVCAPIKSVSCTAGACTYELVSAANLTTGNTTSKVKVDPATGKVTILKGAKAGKYSLRIKVTSPASENYKSNTKTVKCTVFVGIKG